MAAGQPHGVESAVVGNERSHRVVCDEVATLLAAQVDSAQVAARGAHGVDAVVSHGIARAEVQHLEVGAPTSYLEQEGVVQHFGAGYDQGLQGRVEHGSRREELGAHEHLEPLQRGEVHVGHQLVHGGLVGGKQPVEHELAGLEHAQRRGRLAAQEATQLVFPGKAESLAHDLRCNGVEEAVDLEAGEQDVGIAGK